MNLLRVVVRDGQVFGKRTKDMKINGGCHCGKVTYEADVDAEKVFICHCTDCQSLSGGPYRANVPVSAELFKLKGQLASYVKTADSGNKRIQAFCADCGSAIYSTSAENPAVYVLRLGAVKQRAELTPRAQLFAASAMPWAMDIRGIART